MANTKISQLPSYTGTAADLRWFVMNNSGETETFKFSGYTSPYKSATQPNSVISSYSTTEPLYPYTQVLGGSGNTFTSQSNTFMSLADFDCVWAPVLNYNAGLPGISFGNKNSSLAGGVNIANYGITNTSTSDAGTFIDNVNGTISAPGHGVVIGCVVPNLNSPAAVAIGSYQAVGTGGGIRNIFIGGYVNTKNNDGDINTFIASTSCTIGGSTNWCSIYNSNSSSIYAGSYNAISNGTNNSLTSTNYSQLLGGTYNTLASNDYSAIIGGTGNTMASSISAANGKGNYIINSRGCAVEKDGQYQSNNVNYIGCDNVRLENLNDVTIINCKNIVAENGGVGTGTTIFRNTYTLGANIFQAETYVSTGATTNIVIDPLQQDYIEINTDGSTTYNISFTFVDSAIYANIHLYINYVAGSTVNFVNGTYTQWRWANNTAPVFSGTNRNIIVMSTWANDDVWEVSRSMYMS